MRLRNPLAGISDHRRAQGRMYDLSSLLLFSILAVLSGATSYRKIERFIVSYLDRLNALCALSWKRAPAHKSIRYALQGLDPEAEEKVFRDHAAALNGESVSLPPISIRSSVTTGPSKIASIRAKIVIACLVIPSRFATSR